MARRTIEERAREALAFARQLVAEGTGWLEAEHALFGVGGKCDVLFPNRRERSGYLKTDEHRQIGELLAGLYVLPAPQERQEGEPLDGVPEDLHVRLPHKTVRALRAQAEAAGLGLDQFIVRKLTELAQPGVAGATAAPRKKRA